MVKIFLSSHGHFASGLKSSLTILLGNADNVTVFDAYVDDASVKDALEDFYTKVEANDTVLLLSDLYGGSVNQVMSTYLDRDNTMLIAGVNLAFVLEVLVQETVTKEIINEIIESSRQMLRLVELDLITDSQDDFF